MASGWVGLPQVEGIVGSEYVALCRPLPGAVVTWFVTWLSREPARCGAAAFDIVPYEVSSRAHTCVDLGETAHLPAALEANLAHRGRDLERLLTPPRGRNEFDRGRQAANHRGEVSLGMGLEQCIEGFSKRSRSTLPLARSPCRKSIPRCWRSSEPGGPVSAGSPSSFTPADYRRMLVLA
jgi:hypothetical protein